MKPLKRSFIPALCLILCLALLPVNVFAEDSSLPYNIRDSINWSSTGGKIYRLQDGRDVTTGFSYTIPEGGVTMLIFFSTTCGNCQADFYALSGEEWISDPRLNILALETNGAARGDVQSFMDELTGESQEYFHTYYGQGCTNVMWRYFERTVNEEYLTWPLIVLVRDRCGVRTIRSATMGYQYVSDIEDAVNAMYAESAEENGSWNVSWEWSEDSESARAVFTSDTGEQRSADAQVVKQTTPAKCEEAGKTTWTATVTFSCTTYTDTRETVIPALGHTIVTDAAVPATCETAGLTEGSHCSVCNEVLTEQEEIPALGHDWDEGVVTKEATCTEAGARTFTCRNDSSHKRTETIPANGHTVVVDPAVPATCEEDGLTEGNHCSVCGEILTTQQTIPAAHTAGEAVRENEIPGVSYEEVVYCTVCGEELSRTTKPIASFTDVSDPGAYYYKPVYWAAANGITTGTSDTTFSPNASCSRGQIVTFLWRAYGSHAPAGAGNPFRDVKAGAYYYEAVLWAVEKGITTGTSAATFSPNGACTRKQIVTFLWRAAGSPAPATSSNPFKDVKTSDYFYDAVLWAVGNGITTGTSATTFSPNAVCSRGQCVTFLWRANGSPEL